ncbi:MAG: trypsin-like peptidase domain-containing protein [bacterium]
MLKKIILLILISINIAFRINSFSFSNSEIKNLKHWVNIEEKSIKSVVKVINYYNKFNWLKPYKSFDDEIFYGTGFFINNSGHILTNYHVIEDASEVKINIPSISNKLLKVTIVSIYPELDIALLKLANSGKIFLTKKLNKIEYLKLGNSDKIKSGEPVITLGYPLNSTNLISTSGIIGTPKIGTDIQFSAPISRGNSGGPLINLKGEVIGINTRINGNGQNTNFAIQINTAKKNLNYLKKQNVLNLANSGFETILVHDDFIKYFEYPIEGGCFIHKVHDEGLAKKIGIKKGYLITEINGNKIDKACNVWIKGFDHPINLFDYTKGLEFGQNVNLVAYKRNKKKIINFKLEPEEDNKIHRVYTEINNEKIDYEIFGGLVLMNLTLNHVDLLSQNINDLNKYYYPENQQEPAVIITNVFQNSPASKRYMYPGLVINTINEIEIKTLEDLKEVFENINIDSNLRILTKDNCFFIMPVKKILKHENNLFLKYKYNKSKLFDLIKTK